MSCNRLQSQQNLTYSQIEQKSKYEAKENPLKEQLSEFNLLKVSELSVSQQQQIKTQVSNSNNYPRRFIPSSSTNQKGDLVSHQDLNKEEEFIQKKFDKNFQNHLSDHQSFGVQHNQNNNIEYFTLECSQNQIDNQQQQQQQHQQSSTTAEIPSLLSSIYSQNNSNVNQKSDKHSFNNSNSSYRKKKESEKILDIFKEKYMKRIKPYEQIAEKENQFYVERKKSLENKLIEYSESEQQQEQQQQLSMGNGQQQNREIQLQLTVERLMVELRMANKLVSFLENQNQFFIEKINKIEQQSKSNQSQPSDELYGVPNTSGNFNNANIPLNSKEFLLIKEQNEQLHIKVQQLQRDNIELVKQNNNTNNLNINLQQQIAQIKSDNQQQQQQFKLEIQQLSKDNSHLREEYITQIRNSKQEQENEFRQLEIKVRETIFKKDECIKKLNKVIDELLINNNNNDSYSKNNIL